MKKILTLLTLSSLVVLAGCSSAERASVNTNATGDANTNTQVVAITNSESNVNGAKNTNEVVNENANTNADVESDEVDTSDWVTYSNEEYGFSFKYPAEWGDIQEAESGIGKSIYFDHNNSSLSHDDLNWVPPIHLQWAFKDVIQTDCTKDDTEEVYWAVNRECQILEFNGESYKQKKSYLTEGMVWSIAYLLRDRDNSFSVSIQIRGASDDEIEESDYFILIENILRTVSID